jgi:hypothetical protein
MNRTPNYEDCINFIERIMKKENKTLYNFQKDILKAFIEGKEVRTARCAGRSYLAKLYGLYISSLYAENNYNKEPDIVIDYKKVVMETETGLCDYNKIEKICPKIVWEIEYECKKNS